MYFPKHWADCNDLHSCSSFSQDNYTSNSDDDGLLDLLFGQDFPDFGSVSPPRSESTSSDSDMTPSPNTMDDVELSEILSSTSASPGLPQNSEDFTIDLGKCNTFLSLKSKLVRSEFYKKYDNNSISKYCYLEKSFYILMII